MIHNPIPTRAEASDVANAVWDGTDVVMLSGETSIGKYPFKAVHIMNDIVRNAEVHIPEVKHTDFKIPTNIEENLFDAVGRAVTEMSKQINAAAIVAFTSRGRTATNLLSLDPMLKLLLYQTALKQ